MERYFIITVDTEGDNCWGIRDIKNVVTTRNANYLGRFQELCERFGFSPTYLTDYEMALDKIFIEFAQSCLEKGTAEIGAHIHSWNQPPYWPIVKKPFDRGKPYLGEYPCFIINRKIKTLTNMLESKLNVDITSFRSGRWYMDGAIIRCLGKYGYLVDCTCTPGVNWKDNPGWSVGAKGTNWEWWPNKVCDLNVVGLKGMERTQILEVPVTIVKGRDNCSLSWLRPSGDNIQEMKRIIDESLMGQNNYVEFMIHSSELMPRGSMKFRTRMDIEGLYKCMEQLFEYAVLKGYKGITLSDYARQWRGRG